MDSSDEGFVLATVQCIGRCASMVPQIAETCLTGLTRLISRKNGRFLPLPSCILGGESLQICKSTAFFVLYYFRESCGGERGGDAQTFANAGEFCFCCRAVVAALFHLYSFL